MMGYSPRLVPAYLLVPLRVVSPDRLCRYPVRLERFGQVESVLHVHGERDGAPVVGVLVPLLHDDGVALWSVDSLLQVVLSELAGPHLHLVQIGVAAYPDAANVAEPSVGNAFLDAHVEHDGVEQVAQPLPIRPVRRGGDAEKQHPVRVGLQQAEVLIDALERVRHAQCALHLGSPRQSRPAGTA